MDDPRSARCECNDYIADAREKLPEVINRVAYGNERIVLTRHSKNVVVKMGHRKEGYRHL